MFQRNDVKNTAINAVPNKSLDVRAKQLLSYQIFLLNSELRVAVSPHVISIVREMFKSLADL